jgi:putative flippase GtrA
MITKLRLLLEKLLYLRYVLVSFGALAVDMGVFLAILSAHIPSVAASAIGYSCGILAHWILSSRTVFQDRVSARGSDERTRQKAMFVLSALLGLGVTMAIVGFGEAMGVDPRISKLVAIVVAFQITYLLRNSLIFRRQQ